VTCYVTCALLGGGNGFVGRYLQKCLRKKGYNVKIISRNPQKDALNWVCLQLSATLICYEVFFY